MTHESTRCVHVRSPEIPDSQPLSVPIYQTSGFAFADPDVFADGMTRPDGEPVYSRLGNPTARALENTVAELEGGAVGFATSSGMGAINALLMTLLRTGDHVIAQRSLYGGTFAAFESLVHRWGIEVSYVSGPDEARQALRPNTRMLYAETISNPMVQVGDLPGLFAVGREAGLINVVDNTFATPLLCRPIEHGADIVVHSTTKYLGGHSDVVGGIAVFADAELHREIWPELVEFGVAVDPFAAWLTLRGIRTLALRMRQHCGNAQFIAERLAAHPAVRAVHYPGLPSRPDHDLARKLLRGNGGVLSFDLGSRAAGLAFVQAVRLASLGPSLGGVETLVLHPASTSHRQLSDEQLRAVGIGEGIIRVSIGIEEPDDIWADFAQALDR
ncbi:aminotransferase class I/II-fold pyridoxal phosphate-dependent enzyme [Saccharopolyspora sp. K220]|uniref:trans-sulfuration enzyme family protein n=1 Tax=Saccharopolyspora soli TaxID=2926618 RepID=UPI001F580758|nr:aminotransferase class I/II-fold pyridoxal phosphate-dependent enzyme [Saccharopolyspora soli]MCI2418647.1 aminotransferase class I/II-fold pyridoxal phosphate-dependent enzyme [Saccharopolyspora soli]